MTTPCTQAENIDRIERALDGLGHTIHGNGSPGIKTEMALLRSDVAIIKRLVYGLVGLILTGFAGVLINQVIGAGK